MTSFSVVAGNFPLALALEPGSVQRASLGIVVIGGVISSLALTLVLVPVMYSWVAPDELPKSRLPFEEVSNAPVASPQQEPVGVLS